MDRKILLGRSPKDLLLAFGPVCILAVAALIAFFHFTSPPPPNRIIISTGNGEGDYLEYAKQYRDIIQDEGVDLVIRKSSGARENLRKLTDPTSDVEVAFVQDGLEPEKNESAEDLVSLGSLYYEPLWVFYRGRTPITRFSDFRGKRIALGEHGGGAPSLAMKLLRLSGVDKKDVQITRTSGNESIEALRSGKVDAAFFLLTPKDPQIKALLADKDIHLMSVDQAEAITRQVPFLHHLVLPHGVIDLGRNLPPEDTQLVATTATLVARDSLHASLIYLLLKAATEIHSEPSIFEQKDEFPINKDYSFPISPEAKRYYKSGAPFWQKFLPFWFADLADRLLLVALPLLGLLIPVVKMVPKILNWRIQSRIHKRYGELKYLETQILSETTHGLYAEHLVQLDKIEEQVKQMKVPLDFSEHIYVLREHIDFVRRKLTAGIEDRRRVAGL